MKMLLNTNTSIQLLRVTWLKNSLQESGKVVSSLLFVCIEYYLRRPYRLSSPSVINPFIIHIWWCGISSRILWRLIAVYLLHFKSRIGWFLCFPFQGTWAPSSPVHTQLSLFGTNIPLTTVYRCIQIDLNQLKFMKSVFQAYRGQYSVRRSLQYTLRTFLNVKRTKDCHYWKRSLSIF